MRPVITNYLKHNIYIMTRLTVIFFLVSFNNIINAQIKDTTQAKLDVMILNSSLYTNGVYKDFNEFTNNSPSVQRKFILKQRSDFMQIMLGLRQNVLKYYNDSLDKYKRFRESNWGVCIEGVIYLRFKNKYIQLEPIGKYSFFVNEGWAWGNLGTGAKYFYYYEDDYMINITNNERVKLSKRSVRKVLENENSKLLIKFNSERGRNSLLRDYIIQVNKMYN